MKEIFLNEQKSLIKKLYHKEKFQFPIISSVIDSIQSGKIYTDDLNNPKCAFILHTFGWSQIIGKRNRKFINDLKNFIFINEEFQSIKIRNYSPFDNHFFKKTTAEISERCKFQIKKNIKNIRIKKKYKLKKIDFKNCKKVNKFLKIDLFSRFWPSYTSFINNSFGYFIEYKNRPVSICYSCGINEEVVEIDVFTDEKFRGKGLAKFVCKKFIDECKKKKLKANWDCFTNNIGSIKLAKSLGFKKILYPYKFYTYNKKK